jgi:hypothetical protein
VPQRVTARGRRAFYRPETAEAFGLHDRGERCSACSAFDRCRLKLDVAADDHLRALYADNEAYDGYFRDRCVFSSEIDIEDSMQAMMEYRNGVMVNYLLTAYGPTEGYRAVFHGTRGRVTLTTVERGFVRTDGSLVRPALPERSCIIVQPLFSQPYELPLPKADGMHGGGDILMLKHLLGGDADDRYGLGADERAGAWSALVGIAANASLASGAEVSLNELASGIPEPDMAPDPFGPATDWDSFEPFRYPFLAGARTARRRGFSGAG